MGGLGAVWLPSSLALAQDPPPIRFSTLLGDSGSLLERVSAAAVDGAGVIVVAGETGAAGDFPQLNPAQSTNPDSPTFRDLGTGGNGFVASFTAAGQLRWATYLGGSESEVVTDVALDAAGNSYVCGTTRSHRFAGATGRGAFPTTPGAHDTEFSLPLEVAFLTSYSPSGAVRYSTLFEVPGGQPTSAKAVKAGGDGVAHVLVEEGSPTNRRLVTFNSNGSAVTRSLQLGGGIFYDFAIDAAGRLHLTGDQMFAAATPGSFSPNQSGNVVGRCGYQLRSAANEIVYTASWTGHAARLAVDGQGRAIVVGSVAPTTTTSSHISTSFPYYGFPLKNALQSVYGGETDAFVVVIDPAQSGAASLVSSSFLGGRSKDGANRVAVDESGQIVVVGTTESPDFPEASPLAWPAADPAGRNAFLAQLNAPATGLISSTVIGGGGDDDGQALGVDRSGDRIVLAGGTTSSDWFSLNGLQARRGVSDAYVVAAVRSLARPTLVVNSVNDVDDGVCDSAHCSLREAIHHANASAERVRITFDIPGTETVIIEPVSPLPEIVRPMEIDGTMEAGQRVFLSGAKAGAAAIGLRIRGADDVSLTGLAIGRFSGDGIRVDGGRRHSFDGLWIGDGWPGGGAAGNGGCGIQLLKAFECVLSGEGAGGEFLVNRNAGEGIVMQDGGGHRLVRVEVTGNGSNGIRMLDSSNNVVSGATPLANTIAHNGLGSDGTGVPGHGISIEGAAATGNQILRCFVGLERKEGILQALGNKGFGIRVVEATLTRIGGSGDDGCVISGNVQGGVLLGSESSSSRIEGNSIGLDDTRTQIFGNNGDGIRIDDSGANQIGGSTAVAGTAAGNVISGNAASGVHLAGIDSVDNSIVGNIIGLDGAGTAKRGNQRGVTVRSPDTLIGGVTSDLRNLISGNLAAGVLVEGSAARGARIQGNWIGVGRQGSEPLGNGDALGTQSAPVPDPLQGGILIRQATDYQIGAATPTIGVAPGNVIAANHAGIQIVGQLRAAPGSAGIVEGNIIGLDAAGALVPGPQDGGIFARELRSNDLDITRNRISGNTGPGVSLTGPMSVDVRVRMSGNFIGPGAAAGVVLGNMGAGIQSDGVHLSMGSGRNPQDTIITGNRQGILLSGRLVDLFIERQSIYENLFGEIVDLRDQPAPRPVLLTLWRSAPFAGITQRRAAVFAQWRRESAWVGSDLMSESIEFFQSDGCGTFGAGQGQTALESETAIDLLGGVTQSAVIHGAEPGKVISARLRYYTIEDPQNPPEGQWSHSDTSAFSLCLPVPEDLPVLGDADGDGVPDWLEQGPGGEPRDANGDGTPDSQQPSVGSLPQIFSKSALSVEIPEGRFVKFGATTTGVDDPLPERMVLDTGFVSFRGELLQPPLGQPGAVQIRLRFTEPNRFPDRLWAHNPSASPESRWIDITSMATRIGNELRLNFRDGMTYDLDGSVDGALEMTLAPGRRLDAPSVGSVFIDAFGRLVVEGEVAAGWPFEWRVSENLGTWTLGGRRSAATGRFRIELPVEDRSGFFQLIELPR